MRVHRLTAVNFRALANASVEFSPVTILLGENNSGKSTFLAALDLFFSSAPRVSEKDFNAQAPNDPIKITIEFSDLTPAERELFQSNLINGDLVISRHFYPLGARESGTFTVDAMVNPEFDAIRAEESKTNKRSLYNEIREKFELPKVGSADEIDDHIEKWESDNPEALIRKSVGTFRGFKNVAVGQLKRNTDFVFVPAVKDASIDIGQAKDSPVKQLIDLHARQTIQNNPEYQAFMQETSERLKAYTSPDEVPALVDLNDKLSAILEKYYKDSQIAASWKPVEEIPAPVPKSEVTITNHGVTTPIEGVGHGLQRAIVLTVLQYMAESRSAAEAVEVFSESQSDIIIGVEEPELYQHPTKQRLFRRVLSELCATFNEETGIRIQVIYTTHSALMVSFPEFSTLRMVRRDFGTDDRRVTVTMSTMNACAKALAQSVGMDEQNAFSDAALISRLHVFGSELAEGFFGRAVVLTEGASDKAVLEATYKQLGRDPVSEGIVITSAGSKNQLERPAVIFKNLGIPIFLVFDNDEKYKSKAEEIERKKLNRQLQRICRVEENSIHDWPDKIDKHFSAWKGRLEQYLAECAGVESFEAAVVQAAAGFGVSRSDAFKSPAVASATVTILHANGVDFPKLKAIVAAIDDLIAQ